MLAWKVEPTEMWDEDARTCVGFLPNPPPPGVRMDRTAGMGYLHKGHSRGPRVMACVMQPLQNVCEHAALRGSSKGPMQMTHVGRGREEEELRVKVDVDDRCPESAMGTFPSVAELATGCPAAVGTTAVERVPDARVVGRPEEREGAVTCRSLMPTDDAD